MDQQGPKAAMAVHYTKAFALKTKQIKGWKLLPKDINYRSPGPTSNLSGINMYI